MVSGLTETYKYLMGTDIQHDAQTAEGQWEIALWPQGQLDDEGHREEANVLLWRQGVGQEGYLCTDGVELKQAPLLSSNGASAQGNTWHALPTVTQQCHSVLAGGCGVPWLGRLLHAETLPPLPGLCSESRAVGWGVGDGGSPGASRASAALQTT